MLLTQTAVKDFQGCCPRRWYDTWVDGNKQSPNDHMLRGQYFETLCLGGSADGSQVTDLRRLKSGEKSTDQLRIEQQAVRFKELFDPGHRDYMGYYITRKQLELKYQNYKGTLDFETDDSDIWDLKLTADLDGYWADTSQVDLLQQVFYSYLYEQLYGRKPECYLIIFEYGPRLRIKQVKVNVTQIAIQTALERFSAVQTRVEGYLYSGESEFPRTPVVEECRRCSLSCPKRINKPGISYEEITV